MAAVKFSGGGRKPREFLQHCTLHGVQKTKPLPPHDLGNCRIPSQHKTHSLIQIIIIISTCLILFWFIKRIKCFVEYRVGLCIFEREQKCYCCLYIFKSITAFHFVVVFRVGHYISTYMQITITSDITVLNFIRPLNRRYLINKST